jgi:hypothetical protein
MTDKARIAVGKFCFGLLAACFIPQPAAAAVGDALETQAVAAPRPALPPTRANFEREHASPEARHVADWVVHAGDNHANDKRNLPFVIVDKKEAKLFVFDAEGRLQGAAPALLGIALGDDSSPGIGDRALSKIRLQDRTTPAGRFVAALSHDIHGVDILMVDYDLNVAIHRVITTNAKERRVQRLATPTPLDNRISFGCINVPAKFYDHVLRPAFTGTSGIVYVLPEIKSAREVFASYDVDEHARLQAASQPLPALSAIEAAQN